MSEEEKTSVTAQNASASEQGNPELEEGQALIDLQTRLGKLEAENRNLREAKAQFYDKVLNDNPAAPNEVPHYRKASEIKDDLIQATEKGCTNLEYCRLAVELDDAVRREEGESVFLPKGSQVMPTVDEYNTAEKLNHILRECIDKADGSPERFDAELKSRMRSK